MNDEFYVSEGTISNECKIKEIKFYVATEITLNYNCHNNRVHKNKFSVSASKG